MKKFFMTLIFMLLSIQPLFAQSELDGRIGMGLGWSYLNGLGDITLKVVNDDAVIERGSILDSPKLIINKFGINDRLAIEPTIFIFYHHGEINDKDFNENGSISEEDKRNNNTLLINFNPIVSYALFQKERVNFYLKGGLSFMYLKNDLTRYEKDIKEPVMKTNSDGIIFGIPAGIGIEWWVLEQMSFDITTMMTLFSIYNIDSRDKELVTETNNYITRDDGSMSGINFAFGNYSASFSIIFWY